MSPIRGHKCGNALGEGMTGGANRVSENPKFSSTLNPNQCLKVAGNVRANKRSAVGPGGNRQTQRRFQKELRRSCRSHSLPALDKGSAASIILVAPCGSSHGRGGLLVAMNDVRQKIGTNRVAVSQSSGKRKDRGTRKEAYSRAVVLGP